MNGNLRGTLCALALASGVWQADCAVAAVTGGEVTGGTTTGDFQLLDPPPTAAGPDAFESPNLIAFDELQDVLLTDDLQVGPNRILPAGSILSSHYVAFDPAVASTVEGFVMFDEPIVAIIGGPIGLEDTEAIFGLAGTSYSVGGAVGPDDMGDDVRRGPMNRRLLTFNAAANSPGDQVRVLTGFLVPEPAAALLALPLLACWAQRRRATPTLR